MSISKGFIKALSVAVIAYLVGWVAYWAVCEFLIRVVGKDVVFNPILSILLTLLWPMIVYADLKRVCFKPQDLAAVSATLTSLYFLVGNGRLQKKH